VRFKWLLIVVCSAVLVGGGAYAGMRWLGGAPEHDAVELAPADSIFYANAFLDPSMDQKMALKALLAKLPRYDTPAEASEALTSLLDDGLHQAGLNFQDDVRPWLGDQVAVFISRSAGEGAEKPPFAVLVATEDPDAALDAVSAGVAHGDAEFSEQSYGGFDYQVDSDKDSAVGVVDNFVVAGNEDGFKAAVDASTGRSLAGSANYRRATARLTKDRLALFYYDASKALESLQATPGLGSLGATTPLGAPAIPQGPGGAVLFARSNALVMEASASIPTGFAGSAVTAFANDPGLVPSLPADSWAAFGVPRFGEALRGVLEGIGGGGMGNADFLKQQFTAQTGLDLDRDVLGWMGDLGISVRGTTMADLSGGVVISSTAPKTSSATVGALGRVAARRGAPVKPLELGGATGFSIQDPSMPRAIYVVAGDKVVIAYGEDAARNLLDPGTPLSDAPRFRAATAQLGEDFTPTGYVSVPELVTLVESLTGATTHEDYAEVKPFVDAASYVIFGARLEDETVVQRVVVGIE
jgi:hypothetical protein